jgi:hypothetical protein
VSSIAVEKTKYLTAFHEKFMRVTLKEIEA